MLYRVTVSYRTAAGALREESFEIERATPQDAEDACVRAVLRQPGREIVGVDTDEA